MPKLYGSVLGLSKEIKKMYGPVTSHDLTAVTGVIRTGATQVTAFNGATFVSAAASQLNKLKTVDYLAVVMAKKSNVQHRLYVHYTDGTSQNFFTAGSLADYTTYGITASEYTGETSVTDYIDLTPTYTNVSIAKKIVKIYGSVNGSAKLIYEDNS